MITTASISQALIGASAAERPTILLVDDTPANLSLLSNLLKEQYRIKVANGGSKALELAFATPPDLVLLDIMMPDMDGYAVCRALKADPRTASVPVIFITARSEVGDESAGFAVGAVDYIAKPFSPPIVLARVHTHLSLVQTARLQESYRDAICMLGEAGHYNDTDTGVHIWRMASYSVALAAASGWSHEACGRLELAAPMHDTGKIGIPDSILRKPTSLDAAEWEIMKTHCRIGNEILSRSDAPIFKMASEIALRHHERYDGSGYPDGLTGSLIPESARIVAIADVFDALSMKRPYKEAWPLDRVMATLRDGSGNQFDPRLVDIFVSILPKILELKAEWDSVEPGEIT